MRFFWLKINYSTFHLSQICKIPNGCTCNLGVDFGEAYEIPVSLQGVPFYAAVVLKVVYTYRLSYEGLGDIKRAIKLILPSLECGNLFITLYTFITDFF